MFIFSEFFQKMMISYEIPEQAIILLYSNEKTVKRKSENSINLVQKKKISQFPQIFQFFLT